MGKAIGLVQVSPDDLYDPRVVIQLGAKYIGDLLKQFDRDPYKALYSRPGVPGED